MGCVFEDREALNKSSIFVNVTRPFLSEFYGPVEDQDASLVSCQNLVIFCLIVVFVVGWLYLEMVCKNPITRILTFQQYVAAPT